MRTSKSSPFKRVFVTDKSEQSGVGVDVTVGVIVGVRVTVGVGVTVGVIVGVGVGALSDALTLQRLSKVRLSVNAPESVPPVLPKSARQVILVPGGCGKEAGLLMVEVVGGL